jgi:hypothetical protein
MEQTVTEESTSLIPFMDENDTHEEHTVGDGGEQVETYHVYPVPGGMVILKEDERKSDQDIDNGEVLPPLPASSLVLAVITACVATLSVLLPLILQLYLICYPPIATVTLVPKSQEVTLTGTVQLGRLIAPLTISQSQTVPTTGKGHQDAKEAHGAITLYNGQLQSVTVAAGTVFTASNGAQAITEQEATIPAATPPIEGQATITAHAVTSGLSGNIPAKSIHAACCALSVLAVNLTSFTGGQNERNFQTVRTADIAHIATPLKTAVAQSMRGALQGQVQASEQLQMLPCTPTVRSDHQIGQEAPTITVTVSETCSAAAYNTADLDRKATGLLTRQAGTMPGSAYSLIGNIQVRITKATIMHTPAPLVFLSFQVSGTWMYALSQGTQQQIKTLIAGKTKQEAVRLFAKLAGIESVAISWGGESRLPKNTGYIHITIIVV